MLQDLFESLYVVVCSMILIYKIFKYTSGPEISLFLSAMPYTGFIFCMINPFMWSVFLFSALLGIGGGILWTASGEVGENSHSVDNANFLYHVTVLSHSITIGRSEKNSNPQLHSEMQFFNLLKIVWSYTGGRDKYLTTFSVIGNCEELSWRHKS